MFFILGLLPIEKLIQFDCCKGHLNKALIIKKICICLLFIWNWLDERLIKNMYIFTVYLELVGREDFFFKF